MLLQQMTVGCLLPVIVGYLALVLVLHTLVTVIVVDQAEGGKALRSTILGFRLGKGLRSISSVASSDSGLL